MFDPVVSGILLAAVALLWKLNSKLAALNQMCQDMKDDFNKLPCRKV